MNIISTTLPPVNSQPRFNNETGKNTANTDERTSSLPEVFAELVDENNLAVPVSAVLEPAVTESQFEAQQRFLSERVDLGRFSKNDDLPLHNLQALASYQSVATNTLAGDVGIARLDIIV